MFCFIKLINLKYFLLSSSGIDENYCLIKLIGYCSLERLSIPLVSKNQLGNYGNILQQQTFAKKPSKA